ncbi:MAG: type IV pilin N-terminal domain-containing protein [Methanomicrobiaceae archaeon]|nr:type IV pilin N-terminal domain-containing protein [Methanomicrobiaceae archaeon]
MVLKRNENSEAVSPVVGVMLMLVVTIIIAAVVSGSAGGLAGNTKAAPQASIDVDIEYNTDLGMDMTGSRVTFTLMSGDSIPTKDLAIITYYTNKSGDNFKHKQTATSQGYDIYAAYSGYIARVPFISDMRFGYAGSNPEKDFGNFTWNGGDVLSTGGTPGTAVLLGINDTASTPGIADPDFGVGSVVDVKIMHIPSGQYIFDKEVVVK